MVMEGKQGKQGIQGIKGNQGNRGERGISGEHAFLSKAWRVALGLWMVVLSVVLALALKHTNDQADKAKELSQDNRQLIISVNQSRLESCRRTYEGVRQVFKPVLPVNPTPKQQSDLNKFNNRIDYLKSQCITQVAVKPKGSYDNTSP